MVLKSNIRSSASPRPAPQHDSEYFFVTLEVYLTTLFSKIFCFSDLCRGRDGTDGTDKQTDIRTDKLVYYFRYIINFELGYMACVADALLEAKEEIFIADWWLTPEIYMKR